MIEPWRKLSSKPLGDFRVFSVREERKVSPRTKAEHDFFVIESPNWVNVVAMTADEHVVMVEQYRQGSETVELEIPGGVMDAGDASPEATGCRELLEETGYQGEQAQIIGHVFPNPAIMRNTCFTVLARNCRQVAPTRLDSSEDIDVKLVPLSELPELVASGRIRHALIVAALYQFELWWKKHA
jgi:8-oxo-dGTP pyrophosphatase MutT (NUDIX family)